MDSESLDKYLPAEFNLAKYDKSRDMDLIEWIVNISARTLPYGLFRRQEYELDTEQRSLAEKVVEYNILNGAIINSPQQKMLEAVIENDVSGENSIVREMNYFDLYNLHDLYKTDARDKLYSELNKNLYKLIPRESLGELDIPVHTEYEESWLRIEMGGTKKEIHEAFKSWLDKAKKEQEIRNKTAKHHVRVIKNFNDATFRKWFTAKVLPYVDLVAWNYLQGNKLNDAIITKILFTDYQHVNFEPINFLRLTTRPHVEKLMSPTTIRRMLQLYSEKKCKKND